jgi:hypothetical protein
MSEIAGFLIELVFDLVGTLLEQVALVGRLAQPALQRGVFPTEAIAALP